MAKKQARATAGATTRALTTTAPTTGDTGSDTGSAGFDINARARSVYGDGVRWEYIHYNAAWYRMDEGRPAGVEDEVSLILADVEGGCVAEGAITWHSAGPRIELFEDAWAVFFGLAPELFAALARAVGAPTPPASGFGLVTGSVTPADVMRLLDGLGVADATPRTSPYGEE